MKKLIYLFIALLCISQHVTAQVPSYVPTDGLVGYWPFNGNANDESGNGNNGTINGATSSSDRFGNENNSYSFDGVDDYIVLFENGEINFDATDSFSYGLWFKQGASAENSYGNINGTLLASKNNPWNGINITINYSNQEVTFFVEGDVDFDISVVSPSILNDWVYLTFVYDSSSMTLKAFNNGSKVDELIVSDALSGELMYSSLWIGRRTNYSPNNTYVVGSIDDIGIWNRALTEQEVVNLYTSNSSNECSTLVINTGALSTNPVTYNSTVNIYPNPANDQITIDCGNLDNVEGWNIKITNMLGQEVFSQPMNTQQYVIPLHTWTGQGMYFVKIINAQNEVVNIKKIVLQ